MDSNECHGHFGTDYFRGNCIRHLVLRVEHFLPYSTNLNQNSFEHLTDIGLEGDHILVCVAHYLMDSNLSYVGSCYGRQRAYSKPGELLVYGVHMGRIVDVAVESTIKQRALLQIPRYDIQLLVDYLNWHTL